MTPQPKTELWRLKLYQPPAEEPEKTPERMPLPLAFRRFVDMLEAEKLRVAEGTRSR